MAEEKEWANKIAQAKENAGDETVLEDEDIEILDNKVYSFEDFKKVYQQIDWRKV